MGTRSVINFYDEGKFLCAVYQQYDGYPEGVGRELKEFIESKTFVNGIGTDSNVFNGFACFVAQFIAEFKTGAGGLYMSKEDHKEEYVYDVIAKDGTIHVYCHDYYAQKSIEDYEFSVPYVIF